MLNVLINAYAVAPNHGSEPGLGWQWVVNLAKHCNVFVITEGEWAREIDQELDSLPQKNNIHIFYHPVSERVRKMCWNQGDWRFYYYYRKWQREILRIAYRICEDNKIDIIHQLNMIGFREPGYLWKISGPKYVWGPIGGLVPTPVGYLCHQNFFLVAKIILKNLISQYQIKWSYRIRHCLISSDVLLVATGDGCKTLKENKINNGILFNETGLDAYGCPIYKRSYDALHLLWVGKLDYRKQLHLAIETMGHISPGENIFLHVVGLSESEENRMKRFASSQGVLSRICWHGKISHNDVQTIMRESDLLFFTSINEGTPHVVLEAVQNNLPVLCFDVCGQGDVINEKVGRKISLTNYRTSIDDFSREIDYLYNNREVLEKMSEQCIAIKERYSWGEKISKVLEQYSKCIYQS